MVKIAKNFCITFEAFEKDMIDDFFNERPHMVRAVVIRNLLLDWVKDQLNKEG